MIDLGKDIHIPEIEFANQGNAILGIRDSGKSYTATWFAEHLLDAGVPFVAFDPIGVWRNLKLPGKGKGYEVVVAGDDGDLPLTPETAPEIVRAAMRENIPLVIDLYSMTLSKADWKKIVEVCVRILLFENKQHGLRHVFIEEAAEFAPQRVGPDTGRVYAEIEKLARMGGNAGLGYTLINQRAEEVNKAVLELCDCLFLHRQKGRHSLTALGKWLDAADARNTKAIISSLPSLGQGECWVWPQGVNSPELVKIPAKRSHHPDRRNLAATRAAAKSTADVSAFVNRLEKAIETLSASAKAPENLGGGKGVAHGRRGDSPPDHVSNALALEMKAMQERVTELEAECERSQRRVEEMEHERDLAMREATVLRRVVDQITSIINGAGQARLESQRSDPSNPPDGTIQPLPPSIAKTVEKGRAHADLGRGADPTLPKAVRAILAVLKSHHPNPRDRASVALQAGYSVKGGGFQNSLSTARTNGLIEDGDPLKITAKGMKAAGNVPPLPRGKELVAHWLAHSALGKTEREILKVLTVGRKPEALPRDFVALRAGYTVSGGGFQKALSTLRTLGLISGSAKLIAAEDFFQ